MKINGDSITFSSGRECYANDGIVGINPELKLHEGYDGEIPWPIPEFWKTDYPQFINERTLTADDMRELADHMIGLWTKFKDSL